MPLPQLQATSSSEVRTDRTGCRAGSPLEQAAELGLQRPPPVPSREAPVGGSEALRLEVRRTSPSPASPAVRATPPPAAHLTHSGQTPAPVRWPTWPTRSAPWRGPCTRSRPVQLCSPLHKSSLIGPPPAQAPPLRAVPQRPPLHLPFEPWWVGQSPHRASLSSLNVPGLLRTACDV